MTTPGPRFTREELHSLQMITDALARWEHTPPLDLQVTRWEAYILMAMMQLITRHPQVQGQTLQVANKIGRELQEALADDPELYALMETGWHAVHDHPQERRQGAGEDL